VTLAVVLDQKKHSKSKPVNSQTAFCPNLDCPAKGQTGTGNIVIHSRQHLRYKCKECGQTFTQSKGTPFYRLRHQQEIVVRVVTLLAWGCPPQAIVAAFDLDERTVSDWQQRAAAQCRQVHEHLVARPRDLGEVQADELRVKRQGAIVWVALAMHTATRLWLGGTLSEHRDRWLITRLMQQVRRCALRLPLLLVTDGFAAYGTALKRIFREKVERTGRGRPRLQVWAGLCYAQVIKRYQERRVVAIERRIKDGAESEVEALRHKAHAESVLNTAFIERLNATFRQRLTSLVRRTRALARCTVTIEQGIWLVGTLYNFCTTHDSLRVPCATPERRFAERTPAMAAGITDHCWSVKELLWYRVPPPRWKPPKRRGRVSQTMKLTIARWGHA
jgi:transposase-like protein/IS1 family transposase